VLKYLEEYKAAFPNAVFVFTSRDPKSVVLSLCGLNEVALSLKYDYQNVKDLSPIGEGVTGRVAGYAKAQWEFIAKYPDISLNIPRTIKLSRTRSERPGASTLSQEGSSRGTLRRI
jgi:hypothetical protein